MDQLQDHNLLDLEVSEETKSNLTALPLWMNVTAITGLAGAVLTIIFTAIRLSRYGGYGLGAGLLSPLISLVISLLLNITLLGAAKNIKLAMGSEDQGYLNEGMRKVANYFRIYGIILICVLVFCVIAVVFAVVVATAGGFGR